MFKNKVLILTCIVMALSLVAGSSFALTKVDPRTNILEFYGGASTATGTYDGYRGEDWVETFEFPLSTPNPSVDAGDLYKPSFQLGFSYGQLRNEHIFYSIGFRFTKIELEDVTAVPNLGTLSPPRGYNESLYDLTFDMNYSLNNITKAIWSPFAGLGFKGGMMVFSQEGRDQASGMEFASQTEIKFSSSLNFGLDLKVWSGKSNRSQVVLSSVNSYDFWASGNRPKYFNLGMGVKYYFRP